MGTNLGPYSVQGTYDSLLKVSDNSNIDSSLNRISGGDGADTNLYLSTSTISLRGNVDFNSSTTDFSTASLITGIPTSVEGLTGDIIFSGTNIDINTVGNTIHLSGGTGGGGTTYDLTSTQNVNDVDVKLTGSDATVDTVKLVAGTNITLTDSGTNQVTIDSSGAGTPGGSNTHIQFNDGGSFGGSANLTWNNATSTLGLGGSLVQIGNTTQAGDHTITSSGDLIVDSGDINLTGQLNHTGYVEYAEGVGSQVRGTYLFVDSFAEVLDTAAVGDYVRLGTAVSTTEGYIYNWRTSGGWVAAQANSQLTGAGFLGISTGGGTVNTLLYRGFVSVASGNIDGSPGIGSILYVSASSAGKFTASAPTGGTNFARKVGQILDSYVSGRTTYYKIYFDPDWYYV